MRRAAAVVLATMLLVPSAALAGQGDVIVCLSFLFPIDTTSEQPGTIPDMTEKQLAWELRRGAAVIFERGQCPSDTEATPDPTFEPTPAPTPQHMVQWADDSSLRWRFLDPGELECSFELFEGGRCWGVAVEVEDGCETSLHVEVQLLDEGGYVVAGADAAVGRLLAGQQAKLRFQSSDPAARGARPIEMVCD